MRYTRRSNLLRLFVIPAVVGPAALVVPCGPDGGTVEAGAEWCEADPVVLVTTPRGSMVPVYVTSGAPSPKHLPAVLAARIKYTATPADEGRATLVTMEVLVSDDAFARGFEVRTVTSSGPLKTGSVYASASGRSGAPLRLVFLLRVP